MVRRAASVPGSFTAIGLAEALRLRASVVRPNRTARELEVLERLAVGDSVAGMAKRLFMSESTVKTHIAKVYSKLGAHNQSIAPSGATSAPVWQSDRNA